MVDFLRHRLVFAICVVFAFTLGGYLAFRLCMKMPLWLGAPLGLFFVLSSPVMFFDRKADEFGWHLPFRKWLPLVSSFFVMLFTCTVAADCAGILLTASVSGCAAAMGFLCLGISPASAFIIICASILLTLRGLANGRKPPVVCEYHISLSCLPKGLSKLRIAVLSDPHYLPGVFHEKLCRSMVDSVNAAQPDMIVVLGDVAEGGPEMFKHMRGELCRLSAPLGTFFISGNHDSHLERDWPAIWRSWGLTVLEDEVRSYMVNGSVLTLTGLSDGSENVRKLLDQSCTIEADGQQFPIVLSHRPVLKVMDHTRGLLVTGHTHGGQVLPFFPIVSILMHGFRKGIYYKGNCCVFTSAGAGVWPYLPVRLCCRAEIPVLVLESFGQIP